MRNIKTIEVDISKLQAELADVKDHENMRDSAVHILKNLGWTRSEGKWLEPRSRIKVGALCASANSSDLWYVRDTSEVDCLCSRVNRITLHGLSLSNNGVTIRKKSLRVVEAYKHIGYVRK